jgi:hypothetical protein
LSVESLPYTLLLLLAQFTAGTAVMVLYTQLRGTYEAAFVRVCSWMVVSGALLTALTALAIEPSRQAEAFALDPELLDPVRAASMAMLLFSVFHWIYLRRDDEAFLANATGATTAGLGVVTLIFLAGLVRLPTWSIIGPLLTLFAGSLTIGAFSVAMIWGHWYLVKPSLDEKPLNDLALIPALHRRRRHPGRRSAGTWPPLRHRRACLAHAQTSRLARTPWGTCPSARLPVCP